jgi:mediator of RNA polymerase II transcription subunit 31
MLDLLQSEHFRKELMNSQCARFIDDQQLLHWQHYQRKRMRLMSEQAERTAVTAASGPVSSQAQLQQPHSASSTSLNK